MNTRTRSRTPAELAALHEELARIGPLVEAARHAEHKARQRGDLPPMPAGMSPRLSAVPPGRPYRLQSVCALFGAPAALADEMDAAGLTVRQATELLQAATGNAHQISPAGVASIRASLKQMASAQAQQRTRAEVTRQQQMDALLARYSLNGTDAGMAIARSGHDIETMRPMVAQRANVFNHLTPSAHAALLRELQRVQPRD